MPHPLPVPPGNGITESLHSDSGTEKSANAEHSTTPTRVLDSTRTDIPLKKPPHPVRCGTRGGLPNPPLGPIDTIGPAATIVVITIIAILENRFIDPLRIEIESGEIPNRETTPREVVNFPMEEETEVTTVTNETTIVEGAKRPLGVNAPPGMMTRPQRILHPPLTHLLLMVRLTTIGSTPNTGVKTAKVVANSEIKS